MHEIKVTGLLTNDGKSLIIYVKNTSECFKMVMRKYVSQVNMFVNPFMHIVVKWPNIL